jgi:D-tyrosyl-tRNA(Tyr) deacylase
MKLVVQRVLSASVTVDGTVVSSIGRGLLVLCGLSNNEEADSAEWCSRRLLGVKLWPNAEGKPWKSSVVDIDGELLLVSQFTLFHRLKGNSPDWSMAMPPDAARSAYSGFVATVQSQYSDAKASTLIHTRASHAPNLHAAHHTKACRTASPSPRQAPHGCQVKNGVFGAMMNVELVNDGPVTIILVFLCSHLFSCVSSL